MAETPVAPPTEPAIAAPPLQPGLAPLCFVVDEEASIRHFLSLVLHGSGIDTVEFPDGAALRKAITTRVPVLLFHNISLDSADAIESVVTLGKSGFRGAVQLMSNRGAAVLEHVKSIGTQHKLNMMPVLKKPFETEAIVKILRELKLGLPPTVASRIELDDALRNNWIEFWYQPKIDLRKRQLAGAVQLMSNRGSAVLEHVKNIGEQHRLRMLPVLKKPFDTNSIIKLIHEQKLGNPPTVAARIDLDEALDKKWIEFWYQPKIDLRRKQLVGAEAFARARHPQHGVLPPGAFMPGATIDSLVTLSRLALVNALKAGQNFAKLGINLRIAVNIPVDALVKLQIPEIVREYRPQTDNWAGLVIDVTEEQIVTDLSLASDITKTLKPLNIKLAIDDFGRGYSSLVRLKELPFA